MMPASLTTFAHKATSALMMSANCASGALFGSQPRDGLLHHCWVYDQDQALVDEFLS
jgi:hypothetical protein